MACITYRCLSASPPRLARLGPDCSRPEINYTDLHRVVKKNHKDNTMLVLFLRARLWSKQSFSSIPNKFSNQFVYIIVIFIFKIILLKFRYFDSSRNYLVYSKYLWPNLLQLPMSISYDGSSVNNNNKHIPYGYLFVDRICPLIQRYIPTQWKQANLK